MASGHRTESYENDSQELLTVLKRYWGYESFRPLQERIVRSVLEGHDVVAVMPTGGGKSLCYQLPAVVSGRTAVVISPLISLMQDQVAQLTQMGIPAAFVNSALPMQEQAGVLARATRGEFRLIYISPERLARNDTVSWLKRVPLAFFAIDEAHCISEWGHEFRPEYRLLSSLRENFPERPIAAFTASATRRVRHDTVAQLQLRDPDKYIKSFHRPNLRYLVTQCDTEKTQLRHLLAALKAYEGESVIVYAPTIARVEETADYLREKGTPAIPYHGQMSTETRQRNQEIWTSDAVRVLVGTIAFGLGIDKPGVRAVIHLSLPKSIEQYYQEAGRAGRDGMPSDCVLLWQKKDTALLAYFIDKLQDPAEQQRSWQRYREIKRFVETRACRHRQICVHFGETPKWQACEACDVCSGWPDWFEAGSIDVRKPARAAQTSTTPDKQANPDLLEYMREWRRDVSHSENIPAFMVLSDASLEDLCRKSPRDFVGLRQVVGIGDKKLQSYGKPILDALERFRRGARAIKREQAKESPTEETVRLLKEGRNFEEIAAMRERRLGTVIETVANAVEKGIIAFDERWIPAHRLAQIEDAGRRVGLARVKQIKDALPSDFTYDEIRLAMPYLKRRRAEEK